MKDFVNLLLAAIDDHIAPNALSDLVYEQLLNAGIDEADATRLSDIIFDVWPVEPEATT